MRSKVKKNKKVCHLCRTSKVILLWSGEIHSFFEQKDSRLSNLKKQYGRHATRTKVFDTINQPIGSNDFEIASIVFLLKKRQIESLIVFKTNRFRYHELREGRGEYK